MKKLMWILLVVGLTAALCGCDLLESAGIGATEPKELVDLSGELDTVLGRSGYVKLSLHDSAGGVYGPYTAQGLPDGFRLEGYLVTDTPNLNAYDTWLVMESADGKSSMTVYYGYRDLLCFRQGDKTFYYYERTGDTERTLRRDFDIMEYADKSRIRFIADIPTAEAALREYANSVYPQYHKSLSPGSIYRLDEYDLFDYSVIEQTETSVTGEITYIAKPASDDSIIAESGEEMTGEDYEGYLLFTETVTLEKHEDGYWYLVSPSDRSL